MEALKRELLDAKENFEVTLTKVNARGLRLVIVKLEERHAMKLVEAVKLRVGWVRCRVRLRTEVRRCYKCLGFGHWTSQCKGPDRHDLCFRCGTEGHKSAICDKSPKCVLCLSSGENGDHILGSGTCKTFKEALKGKVQVSMKILQGNMHRSLLANCLLGQIVAEREIDIAILSKQYRDYSDGKWYEDQLGTAAIWLPN